MRDIIDMYLDEMRRQKEEMSSVVFTDRSVWRSIFDLFGAGSDTTANTILWGLLFLCYDHSIQTKVGVLNVTERTFKPSNTLQQKLVIHPKDQPPRHKQSTGLAERGQEEEQENERHLGYILCLGYLATID